LLENLEFLIKNQVFAQKSKIYSKMMILVKNQNFGQKSGSSVLKFNINSKIVVKKIENRALKLQIIVKIETETLTKFA